ncbi:phosphorylase superfamily [Diplogelasinospora grovesii]|uniref:Phosphorylase superfamily n=1 Tax=Diplogelasinospora grovesii TaxID=303347 RepID=A0AAN6N721_9PEZI|nr:phosphorylase superfamily [Diplogelasinospora grovesii]
MTTLRPRQRQDFTIAIVCALQLEYNAALLVFDEFWDKDGKSYGKADADDNIYRTGRIGYHNVVLTLLSKRGKVSAAFAAAGLHTSFSELRLVLLAGICGGVPRAGGDEILLGDVVISKTIVQYDFGRRYANEFVRKDTAEDNLCMPTGDVRGLLYMIEADRVRLRRQTANALRQLRIKAAQEGRPPSKYKDPGPAQDRLFESSYGHKHHVSPTCICSEDIGNSYSVCQEARTLSCEELGCDAKHLVARERLRPEEQSAHDASEEDREPAIHIGAVASGDTVMKSAPDRDRIAEREGVIAFEMEGAGIWDRLPCIVVKGVCAYADSHRNKKWQDFAAATAASAARAILQQYTHTDKVQPLQRHWVVPFGRNRNFVGREQVLARLLAMVPPSADRDNCQWTALEGLGGVGKTQIALEAVFRVRDHHPDCSIFWVPAINVTSFENAYREIGRKLQVKDIDGDKADVKALVKCALSQESAGSWLLVIDNADDRELLIDNAQAPLLRNYLPSSPKGSILFTTRNREVAVDLGIPGNCVITMAEMNRPEAIDLLRKDLKESQTRDTQSTGLLLDFLADLPLAIKQASAYMAKKQISAGQYLKLCQLSDKDSIDLLSRDFEDRSRYREVRNPVATTWLISFDHISRDDPLATEYLRFMCFIGEKDIPQSLLPQAGTVNAANALGTLKAYAFITERGEDGLFDMHRLVRLAMRNLLKDKEAALAGTATSVIHRLVRLAMRNVVKDNEGTWARTATFVIRCLAKVFPWPEFENRDIWMRYLPHVLIAIQSRADCTDEKAKSDLLHNVGRSYSFAGKYQQAEPICREALYLSERAFGQEDPKTLKTISSLAFILTGLGMYNDAEEMYRRTVKLQEKVLGQEHPDTLNSMKYLAGVVYSLRRYNEAQKICVQTLKLQAKVLGPEHPETLKSLINLSIGLKELGRYQEAEEIHWRTLELQKKAWGQEHPSTLASMNNLANIYEKRKMRQHAAKLHRRTLTLQEKVLGPEHPNTLASIDDLASIYRKQGGYKEAEEMYRQTLKLRTKRLGQEHPVTLHTMSNLASVLEEQRRYQEAEEMYRQTLKLQEKVLGLEHPSTLTSMNNLGIVYWKLEKHEEAEEMHWQTFKLRIKVLGQEHSDTCNSMKNLAIALRSMERYKEVMDMLMEIWRLKLKALGRDHPDSKMSRTMIRIWGDERPRMTNRNKGTRGTNGEA